MFESQYEDQVRLLLRCLPYISKHKCFALKGGTAINLFLQDLPRISVDIDLTYLPLKPRQEALEEIHEGLKLIKDEITKHNPDAHVNEKYVKQYLIKLFVSTRDAVIKIEPNVVFRGFVYEPQDLDLCSSAQDYFQSFVSTKTMSIADLYGSKLCATLDRQHPRDLFDVKLLMDSQGITPEIRRAFIVYLAGHPRLMSELLSPRIVDIDKIYNDHFTGMVLDEVPLDDLKEIQRILPKFLVRGLDADEKEFLLSMKRGEPDWRCLGFDHLDRLPALRWKLINIQNMDSNKHKKALERLTEILQ